MILRKIVSENKVATMNTMSDQHDMIDKIKLEQEDVIENIEDYMEVISNVTDDSKNDNFIKTENYDDDTLPMFAGFKVENDVEDTENENMIQVDELENKDMFKYENDIEEEDYDSEVDVDNTSSSTSDSFRNISNAPRLSSNGEMLTSYGYTVEQVQNLIMASNCDEFNNPTNSVLLKIVYATIYIPFSQVSKLLGGFPLTNSQIELIRKVRRQVKNRLYAQNCRRRRVAHIQRLAVELKEIREKKDILCQENQELRVKLIDMSRKYDNLYDHILGVLFNRQPDQQVPVHLHPSTNNKRQWTFESEPVHSKKKKIEEPKKPVKRNSVFKVLWDPKKIKRNINFHLNGMNIENELALLTEHWKKNSSRSAQDEADMESHSSVDDSQTSESKFDDLDDDVIEDDDPLGDDDVIEEDEAVEDDDATGEDDVSRNDEVIVDDDVTEKDARKGDKEDENGDCREECKNDAERSKADCKTGYSKFALSVDVKSEESDSQDDDSRMSDNLMIVCDEKSSSSDKSEDSKKEEESDNEYDGEDFDEYEFNHCITNPDDLAVERKALEARKLALDDRYARLYKSVLEASRLSETEFLHQFLDFCLKFMKASHRNLNGS